MPKRPTQQGSSQQPELPDNLTDCHTLIKELFARISELEKQLSRRNRATFGRKSAKVDSTLLTGTGKVIHDTTASEIDAEQRRLNIVPEQRKGGGRAAPTSTILTRKEEHCLDAEQIPCPCCGKPRSIIGFDVSYQLEFVRMLFENIQHVAYKYACNNCGGNIAVAQKPYQPIDKGLAGPGLLTKVATDKFWLHQPLYRQEQTFKALGLPINRTSMSRWLAEVAQLVSPIVTKMSKRILSGRVIQSDATTMPVIKRGLGKAHRAFVWVYRGDADYPYVVYDFTETEHSKYPEARLAGYRGIIQTDGTNKFNQIIRDGAVSANCWAHVHCYFEDAWREDPVAAEFPMGVIKSLFDIERVATSLSSEDRLDLRQRLAKPKLALLRDWLLEQSRLVLPKTKLGEAIAYTLNRWNALQVYIDYPFVEISNNGSERSIKPVVLSRRNWLFAGSEEGGRTAATILSVIETCKRLGINPVAYLKDVLTRLPNAKTSQIDDFLPDRWLALQSH